MVVASILASDNVLAFDAILASGSQVQVNSDSYPDLFWALKGGGMSTFAAVTSVTVKTYPTVPVTGESRRPLTPAYETAD